MSDSTAPPYRAVMVLALACSLAATHAAPEYVALVVTAPVTVARVGQTIQLSVRGVRSDGTSDDLTPVLTGTVYVSLDGHASVDATGRLTVERAVFRSVTTRYPLLLHISNGGLSVFFSIEVEASDVDADGVDDDFERRHALNPADRSDADEDPDADGLTNIQEFAIGTDPRRPDTDGDGANDGAESRRGADPLDARVQFVLNETCSASVLNRTTPVGPGGRFSIPNVPVDGSLIRVRVTCLQDGQTVAGQSAFFIPRTERFSIGDIALGILTPPPASISVTAPGNVLRAAGETVQLSVSGLFPDGSRRDLTGAAAGTAYTTSSPAIATVTADGQVSAVAAGTAIIGARNEGASATIAIMVALGNDTDGDGLPDDYERANGLNPANGADAAQDADGDGLTALQEFQAGTSPFAADTDGDGLSDSDELGRATNPVNPDSDRDTLVDGQEIARGTNPLVADTDADGLPDGVEARIGLDPRSTDTDRDGLADGLEDTDGDQLRNADEIALFTDPGNRDTDGDGTPDGQEVLAGCDPLVNQVGTTTLAGRTVDVHGTFVAGAVVRFAGRTATAAPDGAFSFADVPAVCPARLTPVIAEASVNGVRLRGASPGIPTVLDGITDLGNVVLVALDRSPYPGERFPAGTGTNRVGVADFNGDGVLDVAATNTGSSDISILLGNGDGTFQTESRYATGTRPIATQLADVNRDGRPDLVMVNINSHDVSVLLGNADGTFQQQLRFATLRNPTALAIGDVNGDGAPDLVASSGFLGAAQLSLLTGNGDGTFQPEQRLASSGTAEAVILVDVNQDGRVDLLSTAKQSVWVLVRLGNGDGTFRPEQQFFSGSRPSNMVPGDLNGDGMIDLVVANEGSTFPDNTPNTVVVLRGNGDGSFQAPTVFATRIGQAQLILHDINRDGALDALATNFLGVRVFLGNGDGTFQAERMNPHPAGGHASLGDINGDGHVDLVATGRSEVTTMLGHGDGTFQNQARYVGGPGNASVAVADFNRDGVRDIVTANPNSGDFSILIGNGDGSFGAPTRITGFASSTVVAADLNGDGRLDLASTSRTFSWTMVLLGNGDGTFQSRQLLSQSATPVAIAARDVNGDGSVDLMTANSGSNDVSVLLGSGDGTFQAQARFPAGLAPAALALGDVNRDGRVDLVVGNAGSNDVSVLLGNGNGTFQPQARFATGTAPSGIAIADFDADTRPDLAVANGTSNDLSVLLGNGNGTFQAQRRWPVRFRPSAVAAADINADDISDLIVSNLQSGDISVLFGNGDGTFQPQSRSSAPVPTPSASRSGT